MEQYLFLAICCTFFAGQFIFNKYYEKYSNGGIQSGLCFALVGSLLVLAYAFPANGFCVNTSASAWTNALLYSAAYITGSILNIAALRRGKLSTVTVYEMLGGMVLPFIWGLLFNDEKLIWQKAAGLVLIGGAIIGALLLESNDGEKKKTSKLFSLFCSIIFVTNGCISISTAASQKASDAVSSNDFVILCLILTAAISAAILLATGIYRKAKKETFAEISDTVPATKRILLLMLLFCALYSAFNYVGNFFSLKCAVTMDASIQFPVISASIIVLTAVFGRVFFKEKIAKTDMLRILLAIAGIVFFVL